MSAEPRVPHLTATRLAAVVGCGIIAVIVLAALALTYGTESVSLLTALRDPASVDADIVLRLRLPRVAAGLAAGAALANSEFIRRTFAPWVRGKKAESGLRGKVYRAAA